MSARPRSRSRWPALAMGVLAVLLAIPVLALWTVLDGAPAFSAHPTLSPTRVNEAAQWLRRLDPRAAPFPALPQSDPARLPAPALQVLAHDAAQRLMRGSSADVRLLAGQAMIGLSLPLSATPAGSWLPASWSQRLWLNLRATLVEHPQQGLPMLVSLRVGALPLPTSPAALSLARAATGSPALWARLEQATHAVAHVSIAPQGVAVQLQPPLVLAARLRSQWLPGIDMRQLQGHHAVLAQTLARADLPSTGPLPLSALLGPTLAFAQQTVPAPGAPPAALAQAYRLALLAVTLHAFQIQPAWLAPDLDWATAPRRPVALRGRQDHALHYLLSATLAMGADRALADALGLYKEMADAGDPRGSGFSFDDIAADKAGTALGLRALQQPRILASLLPLMVDDIFLMPSVDGLPTGLSAAAFESQYGHAGSPRFQAQMAEVERRIQSLPLLAH